MPIENITVREAALRRRDALMEMRQGRMRDWRDLNDYILPRRLRYIHTATQGSTRNTALINGVATRAAHILESGMMAGLSNPARPWLKIAADDELMSLTRVAEWCDLAGKRTLSTFNRCNLYKCLPKLYGMGAVFGTSALYLEADPLDLIRAYVLPIGQFSVATDPRGRVNTLCREFQMSVLNLVEKFGIDRVSDRVRSAYEARRFTEQVTVIHLVEPRKRYDPWKMDQRNMPWASYWLERDRGEDTSGDGMLRVSGYRRFPYVVFRWDVTDDMTDPWGDGPGIDVLGDAIALQLLEKRLAQAVGKIVRPPMVGPSSTKMTNNSLSPDGFTAVDTVQGGQQFKAAQEIPHEAPDVIMQMIEKYEGRILKGFYADLWLMLASSDRRQITAREVEERHSEKMIQLGPVVDRLDSEVIDPIVAFTIERLMEIGFEAGGLPPLPDELAGQRLRVDNTSILAQAQKLVGTVGLERLVGFVGNLSAVAPQVMDNLNLDASVRDYANMLGVDPNNLATPEEVLEQRARREEAQREAQAAEAMPALQAGADAARLLSETDARDNALGSLMNAIGAGGA